MIRKTGVIVTNRASSKMLDAQNLRAQRRRSVAGDRTYFAIGSN
jgi:hypothetical protein